MEANDIEQRICELVDGTLTAEQAELVRRRLEADPRLAEDHRLHEALSALLDELADEPLPMVDWAAQRETIQAVMERDALLRPPKPAWSGALLRWTAGAAAAAVFVVLVLGRGWLTGPVSPEASDLHVAWASPPAEQAGTLTAGPVRPPSPIEPELVVRYSRPSRPADDAPVSDPLERPARAGTIVISAAAAGRGTDPAWEEL